VTDISRDHGLVDPDDRAYVEAIGDPEHRRVVVETLLRYRVPEQLAPGDDAPDVTLMRPATQAPVRLRELLGGRPVLLVFGSYT